MEHVKVTICKNDSSSSSSPNKGKSSGKQKSRGKSAKESPSPKTPGGEESSFFKNALTFFTGGIYGSSATKKESQETTAKSSGKIEVRKPHPSEVVNNTSLPKGTRPEHAIDKKPETCETTVKYQRDSLSSEDSSKTATTSSTPASMDSRQTSVPALQKSSGLFPRQNSGINAILDPSDHSAAPAGPTIASFPDTHTTRTHSSTNQNQSIRTSYEKPKTIPPRLPVRLTNIFQNRISNHGQGQQNSSGPRILNKAFFDSVHEQVRRIKSPVNTSSPTPDLQEDDEEDEYDHSECESRCVLRSAGGTQRRNSVTGPSDAASGNVNISLTVQLAQVDGSKPQCQGPSMNEITDANKNRTVIIDARHSNLKVETSIQTDTQSQIWESYGQNTIITNASPRDENHAQTNDGISKQDTAAILAEIVQSESSGAIGKALEITGDSLKQALTLLANIVPVDEKSLTAEEMNASEGDVAIKLMRLIGVPQEMRHKIYQEACDEVEVLQDLSAGTFDALNCVLKWVIGGTTGRDDLRYKTRALCAMNSEVDMHSEVWHRLQKNVTEMTETVENAIQEGVEKAHNASKHCSDSIVAYMSVPSSATSSRHDLTITELHKTTLGSISELEESDLSVEDNKDTSHMENHDTSGYDDNMFTSITSVSIKESSSFSPYHNDIFSQHRREQQLQNTISENPSQNLGEIEISGHPLEAPQDHLVFSSFENLPDDFAKSYAAYKNDRKKDQNGHYEIAYKNQCEEQSVSSHNETNRNSYRDQPQNEASNQKTYQLCPELFRQQLRNPAFYGPSDASLVCRSKPVEGDASEFHGDECFVDQNGNPQNVKDEAEKYKESDTNNNQMPCQPQEQAVGRYEIFSNVTKLFRKGSQAIIDYNKPTERPNVVSDENNNFGEKTAHQNPVTPGPRRTSSVEICPTRTQSVESSISISKLPPAPPNSEVFFDRVKHDKKVFQDLIQLEKLVQNLYEGLNPPASKAEIKRLENVDSLMTNESNYQSYEEETESYLTLHKATTCNKSTASSNQYSNASGGFCSSRIPVPRKMCAGPPPSSTRGQNIVYRNPSRNSSGLCSRTPKSSTVSLYHSRNGSESQKSVAAMDNPIAHSRPTASHISQRYDEYTTTDVFSYKSCNSNPARADSNQSIVSSPSTAFNPRPAPSSRSSYQSRPRNPISTGRQYPGKLTSGHSESTTTGTPSISATSETESSLAPMTSKTTASIISASVSINASHYQSKYVAGARSSLASFENSSTILQASATPQVRQQQKNSLATSSRKPLPSSANHRSMVNSAAPAKYQKPHANSYYQLNSQRGNSSITQDYLKSISSKTNSTASTLSSSGRSHN